MALEKFLFDDNEERRRWAMEALFREHQRDYMIHFEFIRSVKQFDIDKLKKQFSDIGEVVNLPDSENYATALHYAAGSGARKVVLWLANKPDVDHLVLDRLRRLPSIMAYEIGHDAVMGLYLAKKEHRQAEVQGIDIKTLLVSS